MAKTVGILYIVSAATMIIVVGSFLLWVAQIFAALMFFKASRRFEQERSKKIATRPLAKSSK